MLSVLWCFWNLLHTQAANETACGGEGSGGTATRVLGVALPDGVIVLLETMHVLTWHPATRKKLGLENMDNPELL